MILIHEARAVSAVNIWGYTPLTIEMIRVFRNVYEAGADGLLAKPANGSLVALWRRGYVYSEEDPFHISRVRWRLTEAGLPRIVDIIAVREEFAKYRAEKLLTETT